MSFLATVIEVYDTTDTAVYSSGTAITDAFSCSAKLALTTKPGSFNFTLPALKGFTKSYDDIAENYKVKIYMGESPLDASDILMVGKILKITSGGSAQNGLIRQFEGKDLGEKAERILKKNKRYLSPVYANTVATVLAQELSSYDAAKMDAENTSVTITSRTEPYWDTFRKVSDYWVDGSTKIQKDFYFDTEGEFVWKNRPFRTTGTTSLVYGTNFVDYELIRDIMSVKNKITVYGAPTSSLPVIKTTWTDATTDWTAASGTLTADSTYIAPVDGTNVIRCSSADTIGPPYSQTCDFKLSLDRVTLRDIKKVNFWYYPGTSAPAYTSMYVRLYAPDESNYFQYTLTGSNNNYHWVSLDLGEDYVHDDDEAPTAPWVAVGTPDWWDIEAVQFYAASSGTSGTLNFCVNKLYFSPDRWMGYAEDATSIASYDDREAEYTDENLLSTAECTSRAETLLLQLKEKTIGLNCTIPFNSNILLGDRCPVTIPHENLSSFNMDVVAVEHSMVGNQFTTKPSLIYSSDIRVFPPTSPAEALNRQVQNLKSVTSEIYSRVVR